MKKFKNRVFSTIEFLNEVQNIKRRNDEKEIKELKKFIDKTHFLTNDDKKTIENILKEKEVKIVRVEKVLKKEVIKK